MAKRKRDRPPVESRRSATRMASANEYLLNGLAWLNLSLTLAVPFYIVRWTEAEPLPAFVVVILDVVCFMKLWSFWHCNHWLRRALSNTLRPVTSQISACAWCPGCCGTSCRAADRWQRSHCRA